MVTMAVTKVVMEMKAVTKVIAAKVETTVAAKEVKEATKAVVKVAMVEVAAAMIKTLPLFTLPILILLAITPVAFAQTSDWNLTVYVKNVPFGTNQIYVETKGPFGNNYYQWINNQQDPVAQFTMPGGEYPQNYDYQVCVGTGLLGGILPSCSSFGHVIYGDAQVTITF